MTDSKPEKNSIEKLMEVMRSLRNGDRFACLNEIGRLLEYNNKNSFILSIAKVEALLICATDDYPYPDCGIIEHDAVLAAFGLLQGYDCETIGTPKNPITVRREKFLKESAYLSSKGLKPYDTYNTKEQENFREELRSCEDRHIEKIAKRLCIKRNLDRYFKEMQQRFNSLDGKNICPYELPELSAKKGSIDAEENSNIENGNHGSPHGLSDNQDNEQPALYDNKKSKEIIFFKKRRIFMSIIASVLLCITLCVYYVFFKKAPVVASHSEKYLTSNVRVSSGSKETTFIAIDTTNKNLTIKIEDDEIATLLSASITGNEDVCVTVAGIKEHYITAILIMDEEGNVLDRVEVIIVDPGTSGHYRMNPEGGAD